MSEMVTVELLADGMAYTDETGSIREHQRGSLIEMTAERAAELAAHGSVGPLGAVAHDDAQRATQEEARARTATALDALDEQKARSPFGPARSILKPLPAGHLGQLERRH